MTLEDGLFTFAAAQTELVALLGEPTKFRFYKRKVEQGSKMPAMVMQRVGRETQRIQCGVDKTVGLTMQIDHYGKTHQEADGVGDAFRVLMQSQDFPVMMGTVKVKSADLTNEFDLDDPEPGLLRRSQSWSIWFVE